MDPDSIMRPRSSVLALLVMLGLPACGGSSPVGPTPSPPPEPVAGTTSGRLVNVLNGDEAVAGATLSVASLGQAVSDAAGQFRLQAPSTIPSPYSTRITRSGWVERNVLFKVPGDPVSISLIPDSFNLLYFDEMCRSFGRVARWSSAPALLVETSVIQYPSRIATDDEVPPQSVTRTTDELRRTVVVLSAGRFSDFASIEFRRTAAGTRSSAPIGALALSWQQGLLEGFGHVAYGARFLGGSDAGITSGEVALDYDWREFGQPQGSRRDFIPVEQHELGHALGYSHTRTAPSFMYEVFLMTVSALDRQAFEIFMQRPNGNASPDQDPTGVSHNASAQGGLVIERCPFLRVPR
jgi:hypothetical protein